VLVVNGRVKSLGFSADDYTALFACACAPGLKRDFAQLSATRSRGT
jgi:hypothetical protein